MNTSINSKKSISEESDFAKNYLPNSVKDFIAQSDTSSPYKPQIKLHWGGDNKEANTKWLSVEWDMIADLVDILSKKKSENKYDAVRKAGLTPDEIKFLVSLYNRKSGEGPVATEANYFYIVPEYAIEILKDVIISVKLSKAGKEIAKKILAKIERQLR